MNERISKQINLIDFLLEMMPDCNVHNGIADNLIVISCNWKHKGIGNMVDCTEIHSVIEEKKVNSLRPQELLKEFDERGWLD